MARRPHMLGRVQTAKGGDLVSHCEWLKSAETRIVAGAEFAVA